MALGHRRTERQQDLWVLGSDIATAPGHPFYAELNRHLAEAEFDRFVEDLCEPCYADGVGRPGIPPGVFFRMLMVGYFEDIESQRGIAWRCADSLSLREFLGYGIDEDTPDHSSLSRIRDRLPFTVYRKVFQFILAILAEEGLINGKTVGIDATTLEANAAMKSIVRKDTGEDWMAYVKRLMAEDEDAVVGEDGPTDEEARRYDRRRGSKKKVSNEDWESPSDPDARITKMKDGRTHLAYKAENVVDLDTEAVLAAGIEHADEGDSDGLKDRLDQAEQNTQKALGKESEKTEERTIEEAVTDKGYHKAKTLADCAEAGVRTYVPERRQGKRRRWTNKPPGWEKAYRGNRRRTQGERGKRLQRKRSEIVERTFAHICETGGGRRSWLRGLMKVKKRYLIRAGTHNLGLLMRKLCGRSKPRALAEACGDLSGIFSSLCHSLDRLNRLIAGARLQIERFFANAQLRRPGRGQIGSVVHIPAFSTGC